MVVLSPQGLSTQSVSPACGSSLAWTSALVGGIATRGDDLAASMVLFFILLTFLVVGLLRVYQGRALSNILVTFIPTVLFVLSLTIWSGLRAHLSNVSHSSSSTSFFSIQLTLSELVAANGLITSSPMLLCETAFQVFGLLAKRVAATGKRSKFDASPRDGGWVGAGGVVRFNCSDYLPAPAIQTSTRLYLDGDWNHVVEKISLVGDDVKGLASRIRDGAEDPTLFYLLGIVPLVLAMILIYTLNLTSYTNPPPTSVITPDHLTTRFHLFLDPASPRIELLPTSKTGAAKAVDGGKKDAAPAKGGAKGKQGEAKGEMYVVKRGWLGGWSLQPAKRGDTWATKLKGKVRKAIQSWILGWSQVVTAPDAV
ncbi:uncharacterized protein UTRI_01683_B [Ustilago trichophora]|uniref:Uncharacterized protein n=1 Tax=Ustilago trichophora TaxID=86804 RepID=A0A5C3E2I8_9BASI|nr:uncharacterized protein UTRI_01683_B [Ustilago trichophora]